MTSCPAADMLLRALFYFWPLLVSTGICLTTFYLFFRTSQYRSTARGDLVLIKVGKVEYAVKIRVWGGAKFGVCSDHAKVECLLMGNSSSAAQSAVAGCRRDASAGSAEEHTDELRAQQLVGVVQEAAWPPEMERSAVARGGAQDHDYHHQDDVAESESQIRADNLAECLWDCYFGSCSKWRHEDADHLDDSQVELD